MGGLLQAEYRYYSEDKRADNKFDIRRSRLSFSGKLLPWLSFNTEYEFQGNESGNLINAHGEMAFGKHAVRFGQFKEPFSLEWQTLNRNLFFAERSTAYSLSPKRDVGLMVSGSFSKARVLYSAGLFNGDGTDDASGGNEHDDPEAAARIVFLPFETFSSNWLNSFQAGVSGTFAKIDTLNVNLRVKSTGMASSQRNIYELTHNTKFGVLQDAEDRIRLGAEAAWAYGPLAVQGEIVKLKYSDLKPAGSPPEDAEITSWYISILACLTGERPGYSNGVPDAIVPEKNFDPANSGFGALCLGLRFDSFRGDKDWINPDAYVSVEESDSISCAITWIFNPLSRFILDYSRADFSDPLRVRVLPDGSVDYIEKENVFTTRFEIFF
jgi:phosphate-selective porin OprO/OprP